MRLKWELCGEALTGMPWMDVCVSSSSVGTYFLPAAVALCLPLVVGWLFKVARRA